MATQATRIIRNCSTGEEVVETYEIPDPTPEEIAAAEAAEAIRLREEWKQQRQSAVDAITVTVNGKAFDGNEIAQTRMNRAIAVLNKLNARLAAGNPISLPPEYDGIYSISEGQYLMLWVLADNSSTFVSVDELETALTFSGAAQTAVWTEQ